MNHQPSTADKKLRLLLLEDCATDAELILHEVRRAGYAPEWQRVETEADFVAQLDQGWEIILADYALPQFTGRRALELLQARGLDVPFILVSGTIGEQVAVAAMKSGANDYLMKDQLARLGAAIERELREAAGRRQRRQAEAALRESEARLALAMDQARIAHWEMDAATRTFTFNDRFYALYATTAEREGGYQMPEEVYTREFLPPEEQHLVPDGVAQLLSGEREELKQEHRIRRRDGELRHIVVCVTVIRDAAGRVVGTHGSNQDITERKRAESELRQSLRTAERARQTMLSALEDRHQAEATRQEIELRYRTLIESSPDAILVQQGEQMIYANPAAIKMMGAASAADLVGKPIFDRVHPDFHQRALARRKNLVEHGVPAPVAHLRFVRLDGTTVDVEVQATAIVYDRQPAIQVIARDITERLQAEERLRNSQAFLDTVIEHSPNSMWVADEHGTLLRLNQACRNLLHVQDEEVVGKYNIFQDTVLAAEGHLPQVQAVFERGAPARFVIAYDTGAVPGLKLAQTTRLVLDVGIAPIRDTQGKVINAVIQHADITERVAAEAALRASERRYRDLFENAPLAIFQSSPEGKALAVNSQFLRLFGFASPEEIYALADIATVLFADPQRRSEIIRLRKENPELNEFESRYRRQDGSTFLGRLKVRTITDSMGRAVAFEGFIEDITARKQAETALAAARAHYQSLLQTASDGLHVLNLEGELIEASDSFYRMLGYAPEDPPPLHVADWDAQWTREELKGLIASFIEHPQVFETRHRRKDGTLIAVEINTQGIESDGQRFLYASSRDITERKRVEDALRKSESQLRESQQIARLGSWDLDLVTPKLDWSEETYALFDQSAADFVPSFAEFARWVHPEDRATMQTSFDRALASDDAPYHVVVRIVNDSGRQWALESFGAVRRDPEGRPLSIYGTVQDVTERQRAEAALRASLLEKTVLLQEVHHRVKNNLQVIRSLLNLQANQVHEPVVLELLEVTRNRVGAMALLHENLYQSENLAQLNLGVYVASLCAQLLRAAGPVHGRVRLERHVETEKISLGLDQAVPFGLLLNELVTNALKHAFPGERSGCIRLTVARATAETVRLTVTDDGVGLPAALDPSHTQSLGLQLVQMLTKQLHGTVTFQPGLGTTVQILFPHLVATETPP